GAPGGTSPVPANVPSSWTTLRRGEGHQVHTGKAAITCRECHGATFGRPAGDVCRRCHEKEASHPHGTALLDSGTSSSTCVTCHAFAPDEVAPTCVACHATARDHVPAIG